MRSLWSSACAPVAVRASRASVAVAVIFNMVVLHFGDGRRFVRSLDTSLTRGDAGLDAGRGVFFPRWGLRRVDEWRAVGFNRKRCAPGTLILLIMPFQEQRRH